MLPTIPEKNLQLYSLHLFSNIIFIRSINMKYHFHALLILQKHKKFVLSGNGACALRPPQKFPLIQTEKF